MKNTIKKINNLQYQFMLKISNQELEKLTNVEINILKRETILNGFRRGKVPLKLIPNFNIKKIQKNLIDTLLSKSFKKLITEKNIEPIYHKNIFYEKKMQKNNLIFLIKFEKYPNFKLKYSKKYKIKKILIDINKKKIDKIQKKLNDKTKNFQNFINFNSYVTIDYKIFLNNNLLTKFSKKNFSFIFGLGEIDYAIEKNIIGVQKNKKLKIKFKFSKIHPEEILQNKEVIIEILIKKIDEGKNLHFLKNKNHIFHDIKNKNQNNKNLINTINKKFKIINKKYIKFQIFQKLLYHNPILVPSELVNNEIQNVIKTSKEKYKQNINNIFSYYSENSNLLESIRKIKINLFIRNIIEVNSIEIDKKKTENLFQKIKKILHEKTKLQKNKKNFEKFYEYLNSIILKEQVLHHLYENIGFINKKIIFSENTINMLYQIIKN
ncbi:trigger factor [Buchnera aphidicola (Kurisakia onigurumii)]|uniref:trigger factor n=1 Tax=Buchnera aphidicola TaxID=9 RepID=UPI0031B691D5